MAADDTARKVELVQTTWGLAAALGVDTVGKILFQNIFKIAPAALQLFPFKDDSDMYNSNKFKRHAAGVVKTVGKAVASLGNLEKIVPVLKKLGQRHVKYGVIEAHYRTRLVD